MPRYAVFFNISSDALARFIQNPEDRRTPLARAAEAAGGKLIDYYWMFGQYDGMTIVDMPDSATAAAIALAVSSTGVFKSMETHELIESQDLVKILQKAQSLGSRYRPPGSTATS